MSQCLNVSIGNNMLTVQVLADKEITPVTNKSTGLPNGYKQEVYAHFPGEEFPVKCKIRVAQPLVPGMHIVQLPFQIGKYGDIELNPFQQVIVVKESKPALKSAGN